MPNIRPITELRNTTEISELCHKEQEPIFITKNGYGDLVIMSIETYERQQKILEVYKKVAEAELEEQSGVEAIDCEEVFKELREKYAYR